MLTFSHPSGPFRSYAALGLGLSSSRPLGQPLRVSSITARPQRVAVVKAEQQSQQQHSQKVTYN